MSTALRAMSPVGSCKAWAERGRQSRGAAGAARARVACARGCGVPLLPEDPAQLDARHSRRAEQVVQHGARADRGELVRVAHEEDDALLAQRLEEAGGEVDVEHRRLVDHDGVGGQRVELVAPEGLLLRVELEQPVDRARGEADRRREHRGGSRSRAGEHHVLALLPPGAHDLAHGERLAGAGPAGWTRGRGRGPEGQRVHGQGAGA